ncbi:MAG: DUF4402 domain-containing protein [Parasphingorhabdus sp.]|nr:DUF4402 domain-containing protein [Parasphingorhabdus sp.]
MATNLPSPVILIVALLMATPAPAPAQCRLCTPTAGAVSAVGTAAGEIPLRIEVTAELDFSRAALLAPAGGEIAIDPRSGQRQVRGAVSDLGGMALRGEAQLSGEPGRAVQVHLPDSIEMSAPNGATATLERLETDLLAQPRLGPDGRLRFSFGGRLKVRGTADGQLRGRIVITADYL